MTDKNNSIKDFLNNLLTAEQKLSFAKAFKFEVPVVPVVPAPDNLAVPTTDAPPMGELTSTDGTVVKYDTPTPIAGVTKVTVVTTDGELPAPDGDITLSNGDVITVIGGILSEIETAEIAVTEPVTDLSVTKEAMDAAVNEVSAKLDLANKTISALVSRFDAVEKENLEVKTSLESFSKAFNDLLSLPMAEPKVETGNNVFKTNKRAAAAAFFAK